MTQRINSLLGLFLGGVLTTAPIIAEASQVISNITYSAAIGKYGLGDLYLPSGHTVDTPVALAIHGGGWSGGDRPSWAGVAEFLCNDLGFAVFNIEYRLTGVGPWPLCGNDCVTAANFLLSEAFRKQYGISCKKVWTCGGSAGGHLALWTGLSLPPDHVAGVISISGIGDLVPDEKANPGRYVGLFGHKPTPAELAAASPLSLVTPRAPPILCTHAKVDPVVPFAAQANFAEACDKAGSHLMFYAYEQRDKGHSIWIPGSNPHKLHPDIESSIADFFKKVKNAEGN